MATLNQLKRTTLRPRTRVGRGGKRGKTSGRGTKGQNARAGRKKRPEMRDIIKKLPKRRGYGKNRGRTVIGGRARPLPIPLERLEQLFDAATEVTRKNLAERLSLDPRRNIPVKIVGGGALQKKLTIRGIPVSASVRSAVEKAGGSVN